MKRRTLWPWWVLAGASAVWLLWMTLRSNQAVAADLAPLTEAATGRGIPARLLINLAGNVVVFAPLGAALALALIGRPLRRRLLWATLTGAGLSLAIELTQAALPGRVAATSDWLLNVGGTGLGALVGCWIGERQTR